MNDLSCIIYTHSIQAAFKWYYKHHWETFRCAVVSVNVLMQSEW